MRRITLGEEQFWTAAALATDLAALGLSAGDAVTVHASLRSVGQVLGGADTVIDALRRVVGAEGCILAYVSWFEQFEDALDKDGRLDPALKPFIPAFDPATSRANPDHGWFAEALRTTPGTLRSGNPGASVAALLDTMSLLHHAEHLADIPGKRLRRLEVPLATADGVIWEAITEFDTVDPIVDVLAEDYFADIVREFLASGQGQQGQVGDAQSVLVPAAVMTRFAVDWLERRFRP